MKQRLIVMNGHRALQNLNENGWKTTGLIKPIEEGIKAGIYNLFISKAADTEKGVYEGLLLFVDKEKGVVYQQVNQDYVTHKLELFDKPPLAGKTVSIQYDNEKLNLKKIDPISKKRTYKL
ncbi:MAG TPA: KfrB domain-containing protein [Nitrosomonas sp.]|nr:KfrB domain-containing protein [Nitrosomonas sp.]